MEALYENPFHHQKERLEDIGHDIQENFQQVVDSSLVEDERELKFNDDSHILSPEIDEILQQP